MRWKRPHYSFSVSHAVLPHSRSFISRSLLHYELPRWYNQRGFHPLINGRNDLSFHCWYKGDSALCVHCALLFILSKLHCFAVPESVHIVDYVGECNTLRHILFGAIRSNSHLSQDTACLHCSISGSIIVHVCRWTAWEENWTSYDLLHWSSYDIFRDLFVVLLQVNLGFGTLSGKSWRYLINLAYYNPHSYYCYNAKQGIVGVGIGLSYSSPIVNGFKYFKKSKGIVTGVITTG